MRLRDDRPAPTRQPIDLPHLPHRPTRVEPLGHDPQHHGAQLGIVAGWIEHRMVQVLGDREVLAVHPDGSTQVERHPLGPPAVPGRRRQSRGDQVAELVMVRRRTLEDEQRPHVQRLDVGLHPEEPGLQGVEPTVSGHTSSVAPARLPCPLPTSPIATDDMRVPGVAPPSTPGTRTWRSPGERHQVGLPLRYDPLSTIDRPAVTECDGGRVVQRLIGGGDRRDTTIGTHHHDRRWAVIAGATFESS